MADKGYSRNYKKIEEQIMKSGSTFQKKCIQWYRDNLGEAKRTSEIERFIDTEIDLGKIRVWRD